MARHHKKHKPFGEQSRRRRKLTYINIKNQIRRAQPVLGGLFYSQDHLHGENGWIDLYFLGKEPLTFYNCTLETARCAYVEAVHEAAWEAAEKLLPYHSNLIDNAYIDSESGLWTSELEPERAEAEFDGLSRYDWIEAEEVRIANSGSIVVHEQISLRYDFACGIGLDATINVPYLTVETINTFIAQFLSQSIGSHEKSNSSSAPLSFAHNQIERWGIESNAIVEPW